MIIFADAIRKHNYKRCLSLLSRVGEVCGKKMLNITDEEGLNLFHIIAKKGTVGDLIVLSERYSFLMGTTDDQIRKTIDHTIGNLSSSSFFFLRPYKVTLFSDKFVQHFITPFSAEKERCLNMYPESSIIKRIRMELSNKNSKRSYVGDFELLHIADTIQDSSVKKKNRFV